jgi:hypothetical protein
MRAWLAILNERSPDVVWIAAANEEDDDARAADEEQLVPGAA